MSHFLSFCKVHIMLLALMFISPLSLHAQYDMVIHSKDGTTTSFSVSSIDSVTFKESPSTLGTYTINGVEYPMPEAVDLGLPSGTKWANMNIGASTSTDYGLRFAFGESTPCDSISQNYIFYDDTYGSVSFYLDFDKNYCAYLPNKYDCAYNNLGEGWSIPSVEQFKELRNNCDYEIYENYVFFKSKINNNSVIISLPRIAGFGAFATNKCRSFEDVDEVVGDNTVIQAYYYEVIGVGNKDECDFLELEERSLILGYPVRPVYNK